MGLGATKGVWRKRRDSNPRTPGGVRISNPVQLTTMRRFHVASVDYNMNVRRAQWCLGLRTLGRLATAFDFIQCVGDAVVQIDVFDTC